MASVVPVYYIVATISYIPDDVVCGRFFGTSRNPDKPLHCPSAEIGEVEAHLNAYEHDSMVMDSNNDLLITKPAASIIKENHPSGPVTVFS